MNFQISFRKNHGYRVDPEGATYAARPDTAEDRDVYPTERGGLTFGSIGSGVNAFDRSPTVDPRLASMWNISSSNSGARIDLPNGIYNIILAFGDNATSVATNGYRLYDGALGGTLRAEATAPGAIAANQRMDGSGAIIARDTFFENATAVEVEVTQGFITITRGADANAALNHIAGEMLAAVDFPDADLENDIGAPLATIYERNPGSKLIGKINAHGTAALSLTGSAAEYFQIVDRQGGKWLAHSDTPLLIAMVGATADFNIVQTGDAGNSPHATAFSIPITSAEDKPADGILSLVSTEAYLRYKATKYPIVPWAGYQGQSFVTDVAVTDIYALRDALYAITPADGEWHRIRLQEAAWSADDRAIVEPRDFRPFNGGGLLIEPDEGHDPVVQSQFHAAGMRGIEWRNTLLSREKDPEASYGDQIRLNSHASSPIFTVFILRNNRFGFMWNAGRSHADHRKAIFPVRCFHAEFFMVDGCQFWGYENAIDATSILSFWSVNNDFRAGKADAHGIGTGSASYRHGVFYTDNCHAYIANNTYRDNLDIMDEYGPGRGPHTDFVQVRTADFEGATQHLVLANNRILASGVRYIDGVDELNGGAYSRWVTGLSFYINSNSSATKLSSLVTINNIVGCSTAYAHMNTRGDNDYCEYNTFVGPDQLPPKDGFGQVGIAPKISAGVGCIVRARKNIVQSVEAIDGGILFDEDNKTLSYWPTPPSEQLYENNLRGTFSRNAENFQVYQVVDKADASREAFIADIEGQLLAEPGVSYGAQTLLSEAEPGGEITGDPISLTVRNATLLDPDGLGYGIHGNGWIAEIVFKGLAAGGTFDASKVTLTVEDPGYDATGAVTRTRTISGGTVLRRQYPNESTTMIDAVGDDVRIRFSLDDDVYAGSTITAVDVAAGAYTGANAGAPATITNDSTLAYPKPLFAWLNVPHERATGSSFAIEAVAYHKHAMLGRQVARIEYSASDGTNTAATQTASTPTLSEIQTKGHIVEAYKAAIPLAALNAGALFNVNAKVYPWIGDASAVLDLAADGIAWPTAQAQTLLRVFNDRTGSYGGAYAYVKEGATGGAVSDNPTTARAAPFPTINAALVAIVAWNNTNRGHNDHSGGTIRLMDDGAGGAVAHVPTATFNVAAGNCLTTIEQDPLNTGVASMSLTATRQTASMLRWAVDIAQQGAFTLDGGSNTNDKVIVYDGITLSYNGGTTAINYCQGLAYWRNVTFSGLSSGNQSPFWSSYVTTNTQAAMALGCVCHDSTVNFRVAVIGATIGCDFRRGYFDEYNLASYTLVDPSDGMVIANNRLLDVRASSRIAYSQDYARGAAIVQNIVERANATAAPALQISADSAMNTVDNIVVMHNTVPGTDLAGRINIAYNDKAVARKVATVRFNAFHQYNVKGDLFDQPGAGTGKVGNWHTRFGVGFKGNAIGASTQGSQTPSAGSWLGDYLEPSTVVGTALAFVNNKGGEAATGLGDYHLTGETNPAYDRVPSGLQALAYDLDGRPRHDDGTGAAGAYEREAAADTTAPTITSPSTASVQENQSFSMDLTADEPVTWAIVGGEDQALFSLTEGNKLGMAAKDFENPVDANGDNIYVVQVRARDAANNDTLATLNITVTNDPSDDEEPEEPIELSLEGPETIGLGVTQMKLKASRAHSADIKVVIAFIPDED